MNSARTDRRWLEETFLRLAGDFQGAPDNLPWSEAAVRFELAIDEINDRARRIGLLKDGEWVFEREPTASIQIHHPDRVRPPITGGFNHHSPFQNLITAGKRERVAAYMGAWAEQCGRDDDQIHGGSRPASVATSVSTWSSAMCRGQEWEMPAWPGGWESLHADLRMPAEVLVELLDGSSAAVRITAGMGLIQMIWRHFPGSSGADTSAVPAEVADFMLAVWFRAGRAREAAEELAERHHIDSSPLRENWMRNTPEAVATLAAFAERLDVLERIEEKAKTDGDERTESPDFAHADDFTWVVWCGTTYRFIKGIQSEAVKVLWEHWVRSGRKDGCGCSEKTIGEKCGSGTDNFRLQPAFRGHPAWGTMIRSYGKGCFALFSENHS